MARYDNEIRITPSIIDRLIDEEPELSTEAVATRQKSLRQLKQSVRRDLEWLLNSRQIPLGISPELKETAHSVANYGLPDFSAYSTKNTSERNKIRRALETAISTFEPRLLDVTISIEPLRENERVMKFRVDARLKVDPVPEPITFDTVLQLGSGQYMVEGE